MKLSETKFRLARSKCEAVIVNVIEPLLFQQLCEDLNKTNFVMVSVDSSNRKEIKTVLIVVQYFVPDCGIKVKLLDFQSVPSETAEILTNHLISIIKTQYSKKNCWILCR